MTSKYFLVYKGWIKYYPKARVIQCMGDDACFRIKIGKKTKVTTRGSYPIREPFNKPWCYFGYELLASGERYWVRLG
jgi:hypothetical protein